MDSDLAVMTGKLDAGRLLKIFPYSPCINYTCTTLMLSLSEQVQSLSGKRMYNYLGGNLPKLLLIFSDTVCTPFLLL